MLRRVAWEAEAALGSEPRPLPLCCADVHSPEPAVPSTVNHRPAEEAVQPPIHASCASSIHRDRSALRPTRQRSPTAIDGDSAIGQPISTIARHDNRVRRGRRPTCLSNQGVHRERQRDTRSSGDCLLCGRPAAFPAPGVDPAPVVSKATVGAVSDTMRYL